MPKKIIIDTDPGIDDAMAILFALHSPEVELVGLTTIFGNVHTALATQNALGLLEFAGHPEIPVAHGAAQPLQIAFDHPATFVHGENGLGEITLPTPTAQADPRAGAQFIVDMIMANPGEITLVPVGPLTNIALALALEPRITTHGQWQRQSRRRSQYLARSACRRPCLYGRLAHHDDRTGCDRKDSDGGRLSGRIA